MHLVYHVRTAIYEVCKLSNETDYLFTKFLFFQTSMLSPSK